MNTEIKRPYRLIVRFETADEREHIFHLLRTHDFRSCERLDLTKPVSPASTRTFLVYPETRTCTYGVEPFIGAAMISSGGRACSFREFEALARTDFRTEPRFPVFHVPHDGNMFPPELMDSVCVPEEVFRTYHARMRDTAAGRFVPRAYCGGDMLARFDNSRLLCDVERFIGPEEEMEKFGMGFCYEKTFDGTVIKRVTDERKQAARRFYDAHHARLNAVCGRHPRVLLIDLHSFSSDILLPHVRAQNPVLPDVCIGANPVYTPAELVRRIGLRLDEAGLSHLTNAPYAGSFVPDAVYKGKSSCDLISVMLEFNKRLYLRENGEPVEEALSNIRSLIETILADCVDL